MQVGLYVARIWVLCVFGALAVLAVLGLAFALIDHDWKDRLTGGVHDLTVTVTGQHRNDDGCGTKYKTPGWDWDVTWSEKGKVRVGSIANCDAAPAPGTKVHTYITSDGTLGGDSTHGYYVWWLVLSGAFGSLFTWAWVAGRGKPAIEALRHEGDNISGRTEPDSG